MKLKVLSLLAVGLFLLSGCASFAPMGALYSGGKMGVQDNNGPTDKTGRACMMSILGLVATGDASIERAKENGGIKSVSRINYEAENVLGIFGEYCTVVKGS